MTYNYNQAGQRLKELRLNKGLSLAAVADECGVNQYQTISSWEKGYTKPTLENLFKLCDLYECELGYILGEPGYELKTRKQTDIQVETGLSELAIDNLMVGISGIENGGLDVTYVNNLHEELRSAEIGRFVKFYFLQLLLENEDIWEQLSVCAFDYRRQIQMGEMDSFHTVEGIPHSQFANVAKNEAKEIISNLFKRIEWDVFSWEDE